MFSYKLLILFTIIINIISLYFWGFDNKIFISYSIILVVIHDFILIILLIVISLNFSCIHSIPEIKATIL